MHLTHLSDEALVALSSAAKRTRWRSSTTATARSRTPLRTGAPRRDVAEDAVQDAFLTLWRKAAKFVPERAKASTWILTIVHRRAVDLVRREERRRADPLDGAGAGPRRLGRRGGVAAPATERVQDALRQLPDQQREALELAYYGGFTQSELAERLGQPLGTIKSRMFTGLARLRELLGDPENEMAWTSTS